jgi:hypothetical protein
MSADDRRERRALLGVKRRRAAEPANPSPLGCLARIGARMPAWAPRRGARCHAQPTYFPGFTISGELVVLPLCQIHHETLGRSTDQAQLAQDWAP